MREVLNEMGTKSTKPIDILVEYGRVPGGTGDNMKVQETGELDFDNQRSEEQAWREAFQGKWADPNCDTFLVKIPHMNSQAEAWAILHEIVAHISNWYTHKATSYSDEHDKFGMMSNAFAKGIDSEKPDPGSVAEKLLKEFRQAKVAQK